MTYPVSYVCGDCGYVFPTPPVHDCPVWFQRLGLWGCRSVQRLPLPITWRARTWGWWITLLLANGGPHVPHSDPSYHAAPPGGA